MITTLTGSNSYGVQQQLRQLTTAFLDAYGDMGLERFDGEETDYDRIRESLESLPFLAPKKMVVLRAASANKQFVEHAERLLQELPETTDVILVEPKLDKRSSYYKMLKKNTEFKEFTEGDGRQLSAWLVQQAKTSNGMISERDAQYLVDRVGPNQQLLGSELNKLLIYDKTVTRDTIDLLVEPTPQSTIFQLLEAAFSGNQKRVLELYRERRASKVEPQAIIAMLAWQLHIVALVKAAGTRSDSDIARDAKLSPYVVQKSRAIAGRLTLAEIKQHVHDLARLDATLKSSATDADDAVSAYLLSL